MKPINNMVEVFEKYRTQHLAEAAKLKSAIEALQSLCPHEKTIWVGSDHGHKYHRCTECGLIFQQ